MLGVCLETKLRDGVEQCSPGGNTSPNHRMCGLHSSSPGALAPRGFCGCARTHMDSQAIATAQRHWHRLSTANSKACPHLGVIAHPEKAVANKPAPLNATENLSHEVEILM